MKTLVAYTSMSGFTEEFATWIAEDLEATLVETKDLTSELIADHDVIIHGGGRRTSEVSGLADFLKFWGDVKDKHVILWYTGANPKAQQDQDTIWEMSLSGEQLKKTTRFFLRGGFDFNRLRGTDRIAMSLLRVSLKTRKDPNADEQGLLDAYYNPRIQLDRAQIDPLVDYVRALKTSG